MSLTQVLSLGALALLVGRLRRGRTLALLAVSALVIYWLQPRLADPGLTFWLPTLTLALAALGWAATAPSEVRPLRRNAPALAVLVGVALLVSANRYARLEAFFEISTPRPALILAAWVLLVAVFWLALRLPLSRRALALAAALGVIGLLLATKSPALSELLAQALTLLRGRAPSTAALDLRWLGFSYVAFRLLHTFFDARSGRLPPVDLAEYVCFVIFFPAFTAGPIDRIERFVADLRAPRPLDRAGWLDAGSRFTLGLFKKFVLADTLALLSLDVLAPAVRPAGWLWLLVYLYAFRIFLDFSGYTDVAIGLGLLLGVRLPENFNAPYLKPNLTQFWNAWHMSLTQWFRAYFFNPLVRRLRSAPRPLPAALIILLGQTSTMLLIGLWHGLTWNYVLWGLWHALGLFVHNRWSERVRLRGCLVRVPALGQQVLNALGVLLTFHFVALGWVFFALPTPASSFELIGRLFGLIV